MKLAYWIDTFVAFFTMEINPSLAKPLQQNSGIVKLGLIVFVWNKPLEAFINWD